MWNLTLETKKKRTAVFCVITQRVVVICYRRFGTTYRSHIRGSRFPEENLSSSQLLSGGSRKSRDEKRFKTKTAYYSCTDVICCMVLYFQVFIMQYALRQVHSLFQSELSTECGLVLPLSILVSSLFFLRPSSSCLPLLTRLPVIYIIPPYLSFNAVFEKAVPTQNVANQGK